MTPKSSYAPITEDSPLLNGSAILKTEECDGTLWHRVSEEVSEQMKTALPTLQSMVLTKIPWLVSIRFVSGLGANELAAAALATTLCNVTGLSLSVGMSFALSTLTGQAKGELTSRSSRGDLEGAGKSCSEEPLTPLVYLFRGLIIQLSLVIPIGIWWIMGTENVLLSLGQESVIASMTDSYLRILAPGLLSYSISWTLTAWCQSIGLADVPAKAAVLGLALHVPFNWFFIIYLELGYLGCAIATVCFQMIQAIFIVGYLFCSKYGRQRVLEATGGLSIGKSRLSWKRELLLAISSLKGFYQYMSLAVPGIVSISEWWASEFAIFLSGRLEPSPEAALGGMTIYQSINTFCFMFPVAFSIAASTRVANLLGEGKPGLASFAGNVSIACATCVSIALSSLLLAIPYTFLPSLFAPNQVEVILETSRTIPLLAAYVFADGIQAALSGILKGCGRQWITMPIVVFAYWGVAVPMAYNIAFVRHDKAMFCDDSYFCGDVGLVAGMTTGTWVHMLLLALVVWSTTDWEREARKAKERVAIS